MQRTNTLELLDSDAGSPRDIQATLQGPLPDESLVWRRGYYLLDGGAGSGGDRDKAPISVGGRRRIWGSSQDHGEASGATRCRPRFTLLDALPRICLPGREL